MSERIIVCDIEMKCPCGASFSEKWERRTGDGKQDQLRPDAESFFDEHGPHGIRWTMGEILKSAIRED